MKLRKKTAKTEIIEKEKLGKLVPLYKWRLAQFYMSGATRGGGAKWEGLSQLMEEHALHGIALHKLIILDQTTFMANKHIYVQGSCTADVPVHKGTPRRRGRRHVLLGED